MVSTLKYFNLRSFCYAWTFDKLASIIKRIPNVEDLSIAIESQNDTRLVDGEQFFSLFSTLSLRKFNYFLQLCESSSSIDHAAILSSWQQFKQDFICIKNDESVILYTLPFLFTDLTLQCSLAKDKIFSESYTSHVTSLHLYKVSTCISETLAFLPKCRRLQHLCLIINENISSSKFLYCIFDKIDCYTYRILSTKSPLEIAVSYYNNDIKYIFS
jgi:hypothetical protein